MSLANWRDLSIVLLVVETFILALLPGVILYFGIRGMSWTTHKVREVGPQVQRVFRAVESRTKLGSEMIAAPFITVAATAAQAGSWRRAVAAFFHTRSEM